MNIENQVCTFEQAKRLKELGVNYPSGKESFFKWFECDNGENWEPALFRPDSGEFDYILVSGLEGDFSDEVETRGNWNAFTVSELGVMFGKGTNAASLLYDAVLDQMNRSHSFTIVLSPQFLANCLIGMLETGRIKAEEINERLKSA